MKSVLEMSCPMLTGGELCAFEPSALRADFLDGRMRRELADSLRYIFNQANGQFAISNESLRVFLRQLESHPISPLAFSFYCDIVLAIEEDDIAQASRWFSDLINFPSHTGKADVTRLANPDQDALAQRFVRFINTDPKIQFDVFAPSNAEFEKCRGIINAAFELMDAGDFDQAAEVRALLREIVIAVGSNDPKSFTFDGASSFMLWGGIIINANRPDNELVMAQMLVHESSHNLLFGLSADGALVENPDDELYSSPLRKDPRPMDGIYHATFVTARMHRLMKRLIESGVISDSLKEKARKELEENARLFSGGIETIQRHGKLTSLGESIMQGASDHMTAA